ncbi:MAG: Uma2 family endonuclease [bacterium]
MSVLPKKLLTSEEYLEIERKAEYKSEFYNGEMFAMAGAREYHNLIVANVIRALGNSLVDRDCVIYPSDMRVKVSALEKYTYPDVIVACGKRSFEDDHFDNLLNPVLIIEVLSDSTEAYDRGAKFEHYQHIESFAEYLLISQNSIRVEQFVRQSSRKWLYSEYHELQDVAHLESIDCELKLGDVYLKIANELTSK